MLKKVLVGSGLAISLFLAVIFLFGDQNLISINWQTPEAIEGVVISDADKLANLTQTFSDVLAEKLLQENPSGPENSATGAATLTLSDPNALVQEVLSEFGQQFDPEALIPEIREERIKVLESASAEQTGAYLVSLRDLVLGTLKTPSVPIDQEADSEVMAALISERDALINSLYNLKVPRSLLDIHEDMIVVLGTQRNIFSARKEYEKDPMWALVAIGFESEVVKDLRGIQTRLSDYIVSHNLDG